MGGDPFWGGGWGLKKQYWTVKPGKEYGRWGNAYFDPLRLMPDTPEGKKDMQTRELNNGRLGMLAAPGIIAQETCGKGPAFDIPALGSRPIEPIMVKRWEK